MTEEQFLEAVGHIYNCRNKHCQLCSHYQTEIVDTREERTKEDHHG